MVVCFDTLAEESPQALDSSRTRVFKQLGLELGKFGFNIGSRSLVMYCLGSADRRTGDLDLFYS